MPPFRATEISTMRRGMLPPISRFSWIVRRSLDRPPQSYPVLGPHARHAREFAPVVGDDDQPFAARMAADLHVVRTAGRSRPFQFCPDLSVVRCRPGCEREHIEARHEM